MITLTLPWPSPILSPNARPHWAAKAKSVSMHREYGRMCACGSILEAALLPKKIPVKILFYKPSRRKFDIDGMLSRCKSMLDGIAECWGMDDERFRPITIDFADEVVKGGKVVATFG